MCSDFVGVLDESFVVTVVVVVVVVVGMIGSCCCYRYCNVVVGFVVLVSVVDDGCKSVVVFVFDDVVKVFASDELVVMFVADGDRSFALVVVAVVDSPEVDLLN